MKPSLLMNSPASMYPNPHGFYPQSHFSPISIESSMQTQNHNTRHLQTSPNQSFKQATPRISARSSLDSPAVHLFHTRTSSDPQLSALSFQKQQQQQSNFNVNQDDRNIPHKYLNSMNNNAIRDTSPARFTLNMQNNQANHPMVHSNMNYKYNYPLSKLILPEDQKYYQIVNQFQFQKNLVTEHQPEIVNLQSNSLSFRNTSSQQRQLIFDSPIPSSSSSSNTLINNRHNMTEISQSNPPNAIRLLQNHPRNTSAISMDESIQTNQIYLKTLPANVSSTSSQPTIAFLPVRSLPAVSPPAVKQYQQTSYSPQPRSFPKLKISKNEILPASKPINVQAPSTVAQAIPYNTQDQIQTLPNSKKQPQNQTLQFPLQISNYQPSQQSTTKPLEITKSKQFNQMSQENKPLLTQLLESNQVKQTVQGRKSNFEKIFNKQDSLQNVSNQKMQESQYFGSSPINKLSKDQQNQLNNHDIPNGNTDLQDNTIELIKNSMQQLEYNEMAITLKKQDQQITQLLEELAVSQENLNKERIRAEQSEILNMQLKNCISGNTSAWESLLKSQWILSEPLRQSIQDRILLIEEINDRNKELKERIIEMEIQMEESRGLVNLDQQYVSQIHHRIEVADIENEELMIQLAVMDYLRDHETKQLERQIKEMQLQIDGTIEENAALKEQMNEYEKVMEENNEVIKQINQENRYQVQDKYDCGWEMEDKTGTEIDYETIENKGKDEQQGGEEEDDDDEERNIKALEVEEDDTGVSNNGDVIIDVISKPLLQQQFASSFQFNENSNNRQEKQFSERKLASQRQDTQSESQNEKDELSGRRTNQQEDSVQRQIISNLNENEENVQEGKEIIDGVEEQQSQSDKMDLIREQLEDEIEIEKNQNAIISEAKMLYEQYLTEEQQLKTTNQVEQDSNFQSQDNQVQSDITFNGKEGEDKDNHMSDVKDLLESKKGYAEAQDRELIQKQIEESLGEGLSKDGNDNKNKELKVGYLTGPGYSESEGIDFNRKQTVLKHKKNRNEGIKDYSKYIQALKQNLKESKEQRLELEEQVNQIMEASKQALFQDQHQERNAEINTEQIVQENEYNYYEKQNQYIQNYYDSEESAPGLEESQDSNFNSQNRDIDESQNVFGNASNRRDIQYEGREEEDEQSEGYV